MPLYEYECQGCGKIFIVALSLSDREKGDIRCPGCNSKSIRPIFSSFTAKTSSKT